MMPDLPPLPFALPERGRFAVSGVPEGAEALLLAAIAKARPERPIFHIARDDLRMTRIVETLQFFAPDLSVHAFPAWDCLPYDRASPHRDILARRVDVLTILAEAKAGKSAPIVVTTIAAWLQKVPKPAHFAGIGFDLARGQNLPQERLLAFLADHGYYRAATVNEAGEFAQRGSIVDLFPPGAASPLRVDFFGDEVEDLRHFDPLTQRSGERLAAFRLKPVSELTLTASAVAQFRTRYRDAFGAALDDDPLYEAISAGRPFPGMEHWLPLFGLDLVTLAEYLPQAILAFDHQAEEAKRARLDLIADFHQARLDLQSSEKSSGAPVYRPLARDALYLDEVDWQGLIAQSLALFCHPFGAEGPNWLAAPGRPGLSFAEIRTDPAANLYDEAARMLKAELKAGARVLLTAISPGAGERLAHLFDEHGLKKQAAIDRAESWLALPEGTLGRAVLGLESGFRFGSLLIVTEQDLLGERLARAAPRRRKRATLLAELAHFAIGDYLVHADHGIGRYEGLETLAIDGAPHDFLRLTYAGNDKLYVPVENIDVLTRYGGEDQAVELDRLGGIAWQTRKAKVKQRIRDIAGQLLKIAAARALRESEALAPPAGLYDEFCARFPYAETEDQSRAIGDVLSDLASGRPMDRLICGDVGFGKTEIALRAAFIVAMAGKQVAVVTPTTLLCRQHAATFAARFQGLPLRIRQLSRLVSARDATETKADLKAGKVDIVIGTHALLAKSVEFADLGLLIVDEEQHFGVVQKERLKEMRADVNVLTLTATPIPRTLQSALAGIREMSLIATAPVDRLAVRTFVLPFDPVVIREAIQRERFRGGQIFYVCPRIEDLDPVAERLKRLAPDIRVAVAHGRMSPAQLENAMLAFYERRADLLLATNIIESGLDIPSANTLIVHRADLFGLAQLYQLRGRIGRAKLRGYCYLTNPADKPLSASALRRLEVMQSLDHLGAGFSLASHDLDMRGAGNLLGDEQSGHIREVGIELYQSLLAEAVAETRGEQKRREAEEWSPQINVGVAILIPEAYVADLSLRLGLYRRVADLDNQAETDAFAAEMIDRFGPLPDEVENLLGIVAIKRACRAAGIERIEAGPKGAVIGFRHRQFAAPDRLIAFIQNRADRISIRPDHKLVYRQDWETPKARIAGIRRLAQSLADLAAPK